jgi:hypothetical protein
MAKERILTTVKTCPTLSRKYGETVCTACVRGDGAWVRVCPVIRAAGVGPRSWMSTDGPGFCRPNSGEVHFVPGDCPVGSCSQVDLTRLSLPASGFDFFEEGGA